MMRRLLLALALIAPLVACGPDCNKFCSIWTDPACTASLGHGKDQAQCVQGCNEVGGDNAAFINCVVDKGCTGITQGHCQIPAVAPGIVP
jgi:hypothetical protein